MTSAARHRQRRLIPISILQFAAGGAFTPFAFLYLSRDQGLTYGEIGQIFVFASLVSAVTPILLGVVADRFIAVNRLLVGVHLVGALCITLLIFQSGYVPVMILTVIWFALWNSSNSLYNAICFHNLEVPREEFGRVRGWGSFGWILPNLPIWYWHYYMESERLTFALVIAAVIHLLVVGVALRLPHTPPGGRGVVGNGKSADLPFARAMAILLRRPAFWILLTSSCCVFWSLNVIFFYTPVLFKERFEVHQQWIGPLMNVGIPVEIVFLVVLHRVIRRIGYLGALVIGSAAMVARQVVLAYTDSWTVLLLSSVLPAIAVPLFLTSMSLAMNVIADRHVRASAQAILTLVGAGLMSALCHGCSGSIVGDDGQGLTQVFVLGALFAAIPLVLLPVAQFVESRKLGFFSPPRDEAG